VRENENALRAVGAEERGEASQVCRSTRRSRDQPSASTWFKERSVTGGGALLHSSPPDGERVAAVPHEIAQAHERRRGEHSHDPGAHAPAVRPLADDSENLQRRRRDRSKKRFRTLRLKRSGFLPRRARSSRCIKCISSARSFVRCVGLDMVDWSADQTKPNYSTKPHVYCPPPCCSFGQDVCLSGLAVRLADAELDDT
jgi:hypothetical protein